MALDVRTGEVLAMVNLPDFDPNYRGKVARDHLRNRAVTDTFEPGSTIKPFAVAMALESGAYRHNSVIDTEGGRIKVRGGVIRDHHDYGDLTVSDVLVKSSNVGVAKIALSHEPKSLVYFLSALGVGQVSKVGLPGEVGGSLNKKRKWKPIERATLSFGYGLSVTTLQLARMYATIARGGELIPVSIFRRNGTVPGQRVFSQTVASQLSDMLEQVVSKKGTGKLAKVPLYRVAGKTGTTQKLVDGRYANDRHRSLFAGFAPVSNPRVAIAVMIDEPGGKKYYGGHVAAPVFREVMATALRLMNVAPDDATFEESQEQPSKSNAKSLLANGALAANTTTMQTLTTSTEQ